MSFLKMKFKNFSIVSDEVQKKNRNKTVISVLGATVFWVAAAGLFFGGKFYKALKSEDQLFRAFTEELFCRETAANSVNLHYTLKNPENYGIEEEKITFGTFAADSTEICASVENIEAVLGQFDFKELS